MTEAEAGQGMGSSCLPGGVSALQDGESVEMGGGAGCPARWMYFMSLSCTLKNGHDGTFYVRCSLPQFKGVIQKVVSEVPVKTPSSFPGKCELFSGMLV